MRAIKGVEHGCHLRGLHEVIALVRKINGRLEPRNQIEQRRVQLGDPPRERAFELVEGEACLLGRHRVDEIGHGLGLHQIHAAVEKCAQRELSGFREARA